MMTGYNHNKRDSTTGSTRSGSTFMEVDEDSSQCHETSLPSNNDNHNWKHDRSTGESSQEDDNSNIIVSSPPYFSLERKNKKSIDSISSGSNLSSNMGSTSRKNVTVKMIEQRHNHDIQINDGDGDSEFDSSSIREATPNFQESTNSAQSLDFRDGIGLSLSDHGDNTIEIIEEDGKSVETSSFAPVPPTKTWRDVTVGEILDYCAGILPVLTSGDLSSLAQLFFDNLSTILATLYAIQELTTRKTSSVDGNVSLARMNEVLFQKIVPGLGLALCFGNSYYAWMASRRTKQYKRDYTALPYGISTPYAFAMVFNVIYPIYNRESSKPDVSGDEAFYTAYRVALAANFVSGCISCILAVFGPLVLKMAPTPVLLVPIAGISIAFMGLEQITNSFAVPIVGFNSIFWVYLSWYANVRLGWGKWRLPEALQVLLVGIILGWATGLNDKQTVQEASKLVGWNGPTWAGSDLFGEFGRINEFLGLIIPLGITAPTLSLMCLVSAKEAGDPYPVRESLIIDGLGTILASFFGCPFGTIVYIGHPAHKRSGALISYSFLNGILYLIFAWFGLLALLQSIVNQATVGPIVLLVGLYVNENVLDMLPPRHFAAYIIGIFPSICDWVANISARTPVQDLMENGYNTNLTGQSNWFGILSLKRGSLLISLFWTAIVMKTIDRKWKEVCAWSLMAALFALFGVIHAPRAGFKNLTEVHWEQCDSNTDECWTHAEQYKFSIAYLTLGFTAIVVNCAKRCDPTVCDEIDDRSTVAFDDWFADAAKQTFMTEESRSQARSYLPSIREIQQHQREALKEDPDLSSHLRIGGAE